MTSFMGKLNIKLVAPWDLQPFGRDRFLVPKTFPDDEGEKFTAIS